MFKEMLMSCIVVGFVQSFGIRVVSTAANFIFFPQFWYLKLVSKLLRTLRHGDFPSGFIEIPMSWILVLVLVGFYL